MNFLAVILGIAVGGTAVGAFLGFLVYRSVQDLYTPPDTHLPKRDHK